MTAIVHYLPLSKSLWLRIGPLVNEEPSGSALFPDVRPSVATPVTRWLGESAQPLGVNRRTHNYAPYLRTTNILSEPLSRDFDGGRRGGTFQTGEWFGSTCPAWTLAAAGGRAAVL